jgi:7-cyano-7-deazaguanine synthase in queuosine biosynthesis
MVIYSKTDVKERLTPFIEWLKVMKNLDKPVAVQYSAGYDSSFLIFILNYIGVKVVPIFFDDKEAEYFYKKKPCMEKFMVTIDLYNKCVILDYPHTCKMTYNDRINYISGWKMGMQTLSMSYCQKEGINSLCFGYINDNADDTVYRDESLESIEKITNLFNELYGNFGEVHTYNPMANLNKSDIIYIGNVLGMPVKYTITCADPMYYANMHCGHCGLCKKRIYGFSKALVHDTVNYFKPVEVTDEMFAEMELTSYEYDSSGYFELGNVVLTLKEMAGTL